MPQKDDFLLRMVEKMAEMAASILTLRRQGHVEEALALLNQAYREHTGSEGELLKVLPNEQLLDLLRTAGVLDVEKALVIAQLLELDAGLQEEAGGEPWPLSLKALDLSLEALLAEPSHAERISETVEPILEALAAFELPSATRRRLFEYHALTGDFAGAENELFDLLDREPNPELVERGRRFYRALAGLGDEALAAGGLPRDEVEEGMRSLDRYDGLQTPNVPT